MSVRLYCGEYLKSPVPVHFGLNWCSHACFYCFANLNKPDRRTENSDLARMARWFSKGSGPIEYWYLATGHPLLVANDSDPLAKTNRETFRALHDLCRSAGVRIVYQTKGGEREDEDAILADRPTTIYVSVTSDNEAWLAQAERGAPGFAHRVDFIRRATAAGHHVVVGLNPFVPSWWNDLPGSLERLREAGAAHLWHGKLHFSRMQIEAMPKRQATQFSEWTAYGMKRRKPDEEAFAAFIAYADAIGFNCFDGQTSTKGDFWRPHFDVGGYPFFPTIDGFFAHLRDIGGGKPVSFSLDDFNDWAEVEGVPSNLSIYSGYCMSFGRSLRNDGRRINPRSFVDVHALYWDWLNYPTTLALDELKIAVADDNGDTVIVADEEGNPMAVYVPGGDPESSEFPIGGAVDIREVQ